MILTRADLAFIEADLRDGAVRPASCRDCRRRLKLANRLKEERTCV
ncbi:hypothetical protein LCGC14_2897410 [marine sediment metagenome]|uniref:Uncharacterized protein n=1 Tax=marine sediment metagenome TaxID=412755 RepID=A0A0F9ALJ9_9ZZZZ